MSERLIGMECVLCGTPFQTRLSSLVSGATKSCGCAYSRSKNNLHHGRYGTREYTTWVNMWTRCTNTKVKSYRDYGSRGITVHPEWKRFENFYRDMGKRPSNTSIDRINNNGNYEPGNCRWASRKQQNSNQRPRTKKL